MVLYCIERIPSSFMVRSAGRTNERAHTRLVLYSTVRIILYYIILYYIILYYVILYY